MNAHFLSPWHWANCLIGSTWIPFCLWKILYHGPQGSDNNITGYQW